MGKRTAPPAPESVESIHLRAALEERYLAYALSTIMHRALPDARDGLKPVHRRILYGMHILRLEPGAAFKKCAKIVGDVMGSFHPHGDQAIYDALVRLAQDFASRYPLVEGQGNFGNIDGDSAAAYRYTEARMTDVAHALLDGINERTVEYRPNYSGEGEEPVVLPGAFPNLLANGASGIAVGMATSIPPHNAAELCEAALHLIKHPSATVDKLVQFVPGPDFPTGGIIVDARAAIVEAYRTGRGSFRTRARWTREELSRGTWQIVVREIPFQVQKGRLVEKIAELLSERKLPLLGDVRDESAEDIRLVLEPKSRTVDPTLLMESLFAATELEARNPLNLNVLSKGKIPCVLSLREALREWLDHRQQVLVRRTRFRLDQITSRLEVLEGYLIAYLNLDEVIRIIRTEDEPKPVLMRAFKLSDAQAEAILNMRLRALRKLEEIEIRSEHSALGKERSALNKLMRSSDAQWERIADEIRRTRDKYGAKTPLGRRRTGFEAPPDVDLANEQAQAVREPITIVCSQKGWIRAIRGHLEGAQDLAYKDGDEAKFIVKAESTDRILLLASSGKFHVLEASKLPGGRGHGEPVRLMADLETSDAIVALFAHRPGRRLLIAATDGSGFLVNEADCLATTRKGKQVLNVRAPAEAQACAVVHEKADHVAVVGDNRKLLILPLKDVPCLARGKGVRLQRYKDGGLSDVRTLSLAQGLSWTDSSGRNFNLNDLRDWLGERSQAGRLAPKGFPRNNRFGCAPDVEEGVAGQ
ncbi:MAG: DNA topoisomerase IV subunit A [Pseudomonadota bacterium]|nr:DNA topoisomerase IV subunit A [Pseudomonadota bacterium]